MAQMTAHQFVAKWKASTLKETAGYVSHFEDLCRVINHPTPTDVDPSGAEYTYQKLNLKDTGKRGFADVWYKGHFGWEYASKRGDLEAKYKQLLQYRDNLANPPLLVVCDFETIEVHTNFNGTISQVYRVTLDHLADSSLPVEGVKLTGIQVVSACFKDPEALKPGQTTEGLTRDAADRFGNIAESLRINWRNTAIAREVRLSRAMVAQWRQRFAEMRMAGLQDERRSGKPPRYDADTEQRILAQLDAPPPTGAASWSGPLLAKALGDVSVDQVWRVLRSCGIQLQRRRSWCVSTDPEFAQKAADVVALYLDPPENAVVLSVDEKPAIQALERAQGWLAIPRFISITLPPMLPGSTRWRSGSASSADRPCAD